MNTPLASFILAIAPGPDNIFVLTQSALYGVKKGIAVIIGLCLGILIQTLCLVVGLSAFISAVPAFLFIWSGLKDENMAVGLLNWSMCYLALVFRVELEHLLL